MGSSSESKAIKTGIIMPISRQLNNESLSEIHFQHVRNIIIEVFNELGDQFESPGVVSESSGTTLITKTIVQNIFKKDIIVVDLSANNGNVLFELGLRLAAGKPLVLIKDDQTNPLFDISDIKYIEYPRSLEYCDIQEFKESLSDAITSTNLNNNSTDQTMLQELFSVEIPSNVEDLEKDVDAKDMLQNIVQQNDDIKAKLSFLSQAQHNNTILTSQGYKDSTGSHRIKLIPRTLNVDDNGQLKN